MIHKKYLADCAGQFLIKHPAWNMLHMGSADGIKSIAVGRYIPNLACIFLTYWQYKTRVSQAVGWTASADALQRMLTRRENAPIVRVDGWLKRLAQIESPRDFAYAELSISTHSLFKSSSGFDLAHQSAAQVAEDMLSEAEQYALPYLCLMLKHRHDLEVTPEQLGSGEIPITATCKM